MNHLRQLRPVPNRFLTVVALTGLIVFSIVVIFLWRPAKATNDPYRERIAEWTIENIGSGNAFVGYGIFVYRPNWSGPAQSFDGPVLMRIDEAESPVQMRVDGSFTISHASEFRTAKLNVGASETGAAPSTDLQLEPGDTLSLAAKTTFTVVTGNTETVKIFAVAITSTGPPATLGIEQVEWRAWGETALPAVPFVVSIADLQLAGGATYTVTRSAGPELLALDGIGTGATSIGVRISAGRAFYEKVGASAPWNLVTPIASIASQTELATNRERPLEIGSGAFIDQGSTVRIRNSSLVDGNAVRLITIGD